MKSATKERETVRHNTDRENPVPIYIALKIHSETRSCQLIDCFHSLGLCVSYKRTMGLSATTANAAIQQFEADGVVCPPKLRTGVFTRAQVDNIDHNPSSVTAKDSFHGTAISLCQYPTENNSGEDRGRLLISKEGPKQIKSLPTTYTCVLPADSSPKHQFAPKLQGPVKAISDVWV